MSERVVTPLQGVPLVITLLAEMLPAGVAPDAGALSLDSDPLSLDADLLTLD